MEERLGKLIVFEGIDGTGKGSLIRHLKIELERLNFFNKETIKAPGGTELGQEIRQLLFHTITTKNMVPGVADLLLLADKIQWDETVVKPNLQKKLLQIADRFEYSQYAYATERVVLSSITKAWEENPSPEPDLVFFLHGNPEILLERANKRGENNHQNGKVWNDVEKQRRIQQKYFEMFHGWNKVHYVPVDVIQSSQDTLEEHLQKLVRWYILPHVEPLLKDLI